MKKWPNNVEPPEGWEVNTDLTRKYGETIITPSNERGSAQATPRRKRGVLQLFEARKNETPSEREERLKRSERVARNIGATAGVAAVGGAQWKIARDNAVAEHHERMVMDRNSRKRRYKTARNERTGEEITRAANVAAREDIWLQKHKSKFSNYPGNTLREKAKNWANQAGEDKLPRTMRSDANEWRKRVEKRHGEAMSKGIPAFGIKGVPGGPGATMRKGGGQKSHRHGVVGKNGKESSVSSLLKLVPFLSKRARLGGAAVGIPNIKRRKK